MAEPTVRGRFVWHELLTTDAPAAVTYYQKVVGWKTQPWQPDSTYLMWVAKRGPMGGVAGLPAGSATSYWLPYVGTPDIAATVTHAQQLGGKVLVPITDIPNAGRYAVLADPSGASFGVYWSAKATAATGMPQLGEFAWHELATDNHPAAFAFYQALFGWEKTGEHDMGAMGVYFMFGLNGQALGGMYNKPPGMPANWCCYAQVADTHLSVKAALKAGGKVLNGPMQVPGGSWIAQIADPQGALHAVVSEPPAAAAAPPAKAVVKKVVKKKAAAKKKVAAKPKQAVVSKSAKKKVAKKSAKKMAKKKVSKKTARKPLPKKKMGKKKVALKKLKHAAKTKVAKKKGTAKRKK